jgi:hypothetical protein
VSRLDSGSLAIAAQSLGLHRRLGFPAYDWLSDKLIGDLHVVSALRLLPRFSALTRVYLVVKGRAAPGEAGRLPPLNRCS